MPASSSSICERLREPRRALRALSHSPTLSRHQPPIVEIEQYRGVVPLARLEREVGARMILGGAGAQSQRADVVALRYIGLSQHLGPGKHGRAGKQRRYMPPAVD